MSLSPTVTWVSIIIASMALTWLVVRLTTPMSIMNGEEAFGVYRGEDLHLRIGAEPTTVRVMRDIDIPLMHAPNVGELDGDRDVAWAWGTHPSSRP